MAGEGPGEPLPISDPPPESRRRYGRVLLVAVALVITIAVALATRSAGSNASEQAGSIELLPPSSQELSAGGVVPTAGTARDARWKVVERQARVSDLSAIDFVNDDEGFAAGPGILLSTVDGGQVWGVDSIPSGVSNLDALACLSAFDCLAGGWTSSGAAVLLRSTDGGRTWGALQLPVGLNDLTHLSCGAARDCVATGQGEGQAPWVMASSDAGATSTTEPLSPGLGSIADLSCAGPSFCILGGGSRPYKEYFPSGTGVVEITSNGGHVWRLVSLPLSNAVCQTIPGRSGVSCTGPLGPVSGRGPTPAWPVLALSCSTESFCVDVNGTNDLESTDGGEKWTTIGGSFTCGSPPCMPVTPASVDLVTSRIGWMTSWGSVRGIPVRGRGRAVVRGSDFADPHRGPDMEHRGHDRLSARDLMSGCQPLLGSSNDKHHG
jgi:photosystem II stability/assembly factor-like uncharacterized protein